MKDWYKKVPVLWSMIIALLGSAVYLLVQVDSYSGRIDNLKAEAKKLKFKNIEQDSTISFQKIDIERLTSRLNQKDTEVQSLQTALKYLPE